MIAIRALLAGVLAASVVGTAEAAADDAARALATGNAAFAIDLYQKLAKSSGNLFFSPMSLSSALAMTYAGAKGDTALQMAKTLHLPTDDKALHAAFGALTKKFNAKSPDYQLAVANALWAQKGTSFLDDFKNTVTANYGAGLTPLDFARDTEGARAKINKWVVDQTHGKIANLLKPGVLSAAVRLVLTNAIYFNGSWAEPFKKDKTREEPFHLSADKSIPAPLMHSTRSVGYAEDEQAQAVELPYKGEDLSMVVLLPKSANTTADFERTLTPEKIAARIKAFRKQKVDVTIPQFKMTAEFELAKELSALGMPLALSEAADFSGMTGKKDLFISKVVHKAFVDVNEQGTEAAAATGVVMSVTAMRIEPPTPVFRADHPFVFLIRDRRSDSILFMGRLANPIE